MDLDALRFADFGPLDDAVDDWSTVIRDLETLEKSADKGLRRSANKAHWAGVNAAVSREFIGKTAGEFTDALTQATSIRNILRDTCSELKGYRTKVRDAIERGLAKNLTVTSAGDGGFTVTMNVHPDRTAKGTTVPEHSQSDVTALRDEVQKILDDATRCDSSANTVLRALADQTKVGFSDAPVYQDRDAAHEAVTTANELAELARRRPEDLTPRDVGRLNKGLMKYADDELFADRFAGRLGAQGTLDLWTGLTDPHRAHGVESERGEKYAELQKNLGLTLATATQSDSAAMTDWKTRMVDLVDKPVGQGGGFPLGGQVMSNLMRWGNYDDHFLVRYGEKLIDAEKKFTGNGAHGAWSRIASDSLLNHTGTDSGWDPMTGYLKALSNSPDAATDFFNGTFVTKDEDHDFTKEVDGKEVKRSLSTFEYFFEERDWPDDVDDKGEDSIVGRNHLAMALEAATTGHPAGEIPTADTPPHSAGQARLMEKLVSSIGEDPERLTKYGYMSDSIGQITSEYLPDVNRSLTNTMRENEEKWSDVERLYPIAGAEARLNPTDVTKLLFTVGQNEDGYAAVEVGQKQYMGMLMDYHLSPDLPSSQRAFDDPMSTIRHIAGQSGAVSGVLSIGAQEAIGEEASDKDKKYEHSIAQRKNLISGGLGTAVGVGASFIATPWIGAAVGGTTGTVTSVVLEAVFEDAEGQAKKEAERTGGAFWQSGLVRNHEIADSAARQAARVYNLRDVRDIGWAAGEAAEQGYLNARPMLTGQHPGSLGAYK
ncbi:DUF6571 family protein [Streptomyces sp. NPDC051207]|uniref:DUF6571 family protein n=1 Tax=Streptomyces sp. NPDC051207 TaxID=3154641 RepID=UPI00342AAEE3